MNRLKKDSTPASTPNPNTKVKRKDSSPSTNNRKTKQGQRRKCVKKEKAVFIDDSSSSSSRSRTDSQSSQSSYASDDVYIDSVQLHEKTVDPTIAAAASTASVSLPLQISSVITNFHVAYTDNIDEDVGSNINLSNSIVTSDSFPLSTSPVLRSSSQKCTNFNNETKISNQFYQPSATSFTDDDFLAHLEKIFDKHGGDDHHPSSSSDDDLLSILSLDQESTLSFL